MSELTIDLSLMTPGQTITITGTAGTLIATKVDDVSWTMVEHPLNLDPLYPNGCPGQVFGGTTGGVLHTNVILIPGWADAACGPRRFTVQVTEAIVT